MLLRICCRDLRDELAGGVTAAYRRKKAPQADTLQSDGMALVSAQIPWCGTSIWSKKSKKLEIKKMEARIKCTGFVHLLAWGLCRALSLSPAAAVRVMTAARRGSQSGMEECFGAVPGKKDS